MSILYILIPLALALSGLALAAYIWTARAGQYDDLDTPPLRILSDDEPRTPSLETKANSSMRTK